MKTTLNKINAHNPCANGWKKLLTHLGKIGPDDEELSVMTILESNGIDDAIWSLRSVDGHDRDIRLFAADCAESVLHFFEEKYPNDDRPRKAIQASRYFANGVIDSAARAAAWDAARAAAWAAARAAAGAAARAAARAAAGAAAWDASWAATMAATMAASWAAAGDAAWAAEKNKQKELFIKYLQK